MADMRLVVTGAAGRMGRMLIKTIQETPGAVLSGALEREGSSALGEDAGLLAGCGKADVAISVDPLVAILNADGILDFSAPAATLEFAALAAQARIAHIIGTTGLTADDLTKIRAAARHAAIVRSGNMSLGVNLLAALTRRAARALGEDFDIEIVEMLRLAARRHRRRQPCRDIRRRGRAHRTHPSCGRSGCFRTGRREGRALGAWTQGRTLFDGRRAGPRRSLTGRRQIKAPVRFLEPGRSLSERYRRSPVSCSSAVKILMKSR
jgi:hypothetical protein